MTAEKETSLVGPVFEGEVVTDAEYAEVQRRKFGPVQPVVVVVQQVVRHEPTRTAAKHTARHLVYVPVGFGVLVRRLWESSTGAQHARLLRAAELTGDWDRIGEWEQRAEAARERRHKRRLDWLQAPILIARAMLVSAVALAAVLMTLGLVLFGTSRNPVDFLAPWVAVFSFVRWAMWAVAVAWGPLILIGPWLAVLGLWHVGRKSGNAPAWVQTAGQDMGSLVIDERTIAQALQHLGNARLKEYFKQGGILQYTILPHRDAGDLGVTTQLRLPQGVPAVEVIKAKPRLCANLNRASVEVWPSTGEDEGLLSMFVADHGALDSGAGRWPLIESDMPVDVLAGIPVAITLRGEQVIAPLDGTNWLIGGRPGQGKSNFARLLVMGAALDPTAELWTFVLADNADFDPLAERFTRYEVGMRDEVAAAALAALADLMGEIERRGEEMRRQGVKKASEAGFAPLTCTIDECHRLFQHREYGKEAGRLAEDVVKQGRKYLVILVLITQSPTATSIPKPVTREITCRVAFSVIDQIGNDALLGDGHYRQGIRATELRPGNDSVPGDRGKCLTVGVVPDSDWELLRGYQAEGADVVAVAQRASQLTARPVRRDKPRDLLEDVATVLGDETVPAADVPALLARLAPRWPAYRTLTGKALREQLAVLGVRVASTANRWPVDPEDVRAALARRKASDAS